MTRTKWMPVFAGFLWLATLAPAAETPAEKPADQPKWYVNLEKGEYGDRSVLPVWKSYDIMSECMQKSLRGLMAHEKSKAFEGGPCTDGRVANLQHGTVVEPIKPSDECKTWAKVRIASGEAAGKIACMPPEQLSTKLDP
jgi:hypothetical protein